MWGADAIRNSDGTHLDESVLALGKKIYSAYFPTRAHNEWITLHMDETPQVYLLTGPYPGRVQRGGCAADGRFLRGTAQA